MGDCFDYGAEDLLGDALCGASKLPKLLGPIFGGPPTCGLKNSFTGDTLVHTDTGLVPIRDIKIGDKVHSFSEWDDDESLQAVDDIITNTKEYQLVLLTLASGEVIESTDQHPFYILGRGWVEAEDLQTGQPLYRGDLGTISIAQIERENRVETVYNLSVVKNNTYFIGLDKVLVHNCRLPKSARGPGSTPPSQRDPRRV